MMKLIWKYILDLWTLRNQHLHNQAANMNLPDYHQAVIALYEQKDQLPPAAQVALYCHPMHRGHPCPPSPTTRTMGSLQTQILQPATESSKKQQATLQTKDIRTFFGTQTHQSDDLHPP